MGIRRAASAFAVLLFVATFAPGAESIQRPNPEAAADALYGAAPRVLLPVERGAFPAAFPGLDLYAVKDRLGSGGETHAMAWDGVEGLDATREFNVLLAGAGVVVSTAADGLRFGRAFAEVANAELVARKAVVEAADAAWLGHAVADPAATAHLRGVDVALSTWSRENGLLLDWTIEFRAGSVARAEWTVRAVGAGPAALELHAPNLAPGMTITTTYGTGVSVAGTLDGHALNLPGDPLTWVEIPFTRRTNFDGSQWVVSYPSQNGAPLPAEILEIGRDVADGAHASYAKQVSWNNRVDCGGVRWNADAANWSLESEDVDCILDAKVLDYFAIRCGACATGHETRTEILISPLVMKFVRDLGYYTNETLHTQPRVVAVIAMHEHLHSLQFAASSGGPRPYMEGLPRFAQTIFDAEVEADPTSLWYGTVDQTEGGNGVNYLQRQPELPICYDEDFYEPEEGGLGGDVAPYRTYDFALFWGWLYQNSGGWAALEAVFDAFVDYEWGAPVCDAEFEDRATAGLAAHPGGPSSFAEAVAAFAADDVRERPFAWAPHGGGPTTAFHTHLVPLDREATVAREKVGAWGFQQVDLPAAGTYDVDATLHDAGDAPERWAFRVVQKRDGAWGEAAPFAPGAPLRVTADGAEAVVLQAVRLAPSHGNFTAVVTPA